MNGSTRCVVVVAILCVVACGTGPEKAAPNVVDERPIQPEPVANLLDRPFTAEQIRDEWVEGFRLKIRHWTPESEFFEEWTVVIADDEGVEIETFVFDGEGAVASEPSTQRSTWVQLRDHASFPADRATREAVTRGTSLGELDGWLYTVGDPTGETVTEFFFAENLPGAPVTMYTTTNGELVGIFEQIERTLP